MQEFKYFAFISYNSHDVAWGKRLQRKLEYYKLPSTLCHERGWERAPLKPVFFAPTEIQIGDLNDEIKGRLEASRHLIVICSPYSVRSEWVGREIEYFYSLGRAKNIHFFIVDGTPNSSDSSIECYNPVIKQLGLNNVLGANINEENYRWKYLNCERAYVQIVTKLLGIEFDALWQRHKRLMIQRVVTFVMAFIAFVVAVVMAWNANRPIDVSVSLDEITCHNPNLPQKDGVVTIYLDNDSISKRICADSKSIIFPNIPKSKLGDSVRFNVQREDYYDVDCFMTLDEHTVVGIERDSLKYGCIRMRLRSSDGSIMGNCAVVIEGQELISDANGCVEAYIPLHKQKTSYCVELKNGQHADSVKMPIGEGLVIFCE